MKRNGSALTSSFIHRVLNEPQIGDGTSFMPQPTRRRCCHSYSRVRLPHLLVVYSSCIPRDLIFAFSSQSQSTSCLILNEFPHRSTLLVILYFDDDLIKRAEVEEKAQSWFSSTFAYTSHFACLFLRLMPSCSNWSTEVWSRWSGRFSRLPCPISLIEGYEYLAEMGYCVFSNVANEVRFITTSLLKRSFPILTELGRTAKGHWSRLEVSGGPSFWNWSK